MPDHPVQDLARKIVMAGSILTGQPVSQLPEYHTVDITENFRLKINELVERIPEPQFPVELTNHIDLIFTVIA